MTRLGRERDMLERLAGLDVVPAVRDYFTLGEHHFLVEDFVEGRRSVADRRGATRSACSVSTTRRRSPSTRLGARTSDARSRRAVAAVHERGIVFGDLHPSNMLVRADGSHRADRPRGGARWPPRTRASRSPTRASARPPPTGFDIDRYALACLRLFCSCR